MATQPAALAQRYQGMADGAAGGAVSAAQDGMRAGAALMTNVSGSVNAMQTAAQQAAATAGGMSGNVAGVERAATGLAPYADTLRNYGANLWTQGSGLFGQGTGIMGTGQSILEMNADPNSLAGQYVAAMRQIDPDRYVSMAASDVQSSFSNAQGQMNRSLGRQGVAADSARSVAMQQQWAQALAAATSGAKTRARMIGSNERLAALAGGINTATGLIDAGKGVAGLGVQAQGMAGDMQKGAAGIVEAQGQLQGQAGQLRASQAGVQLNAGQLQGQAGQLAVSAGNAQVNAAAAAASSQMQAAQYYASVAEGYGALAGSGGLADSLFDGASLGGVSKEIKGAVAAGNTPRGAYETSEAFEQRKQMNKTLASR